MLSSNALFEIFGFLDLYELVQVSQVCKLYRKVALNPNLNKEKFTQIFCIETNFNHTTSKVWHSLSISIFKCKEQFSQLPVKNLNQIFFFVTENLSAPSFVLPKLRRNLFTYPTVLQDLFANFSYEAVTLNRNSSKNLKSIETVSLLNPIFTLDSVLTHNITRFIRIYCKGVCQQLLESQVLLNDYLDLWEKFSFTIQNLFEEFGNLSENSEFFECPKAVLEYFLNAPKILVKIWTEEVYSKVCGVLNSQFLQVFSKVCEEKQENEEMGLCQRYSEAVFDLSINENSIHFKNHSKSVFIGPFLELEKKIKDFCSQREIKSSKGFLELELMRNTFPCGVVFRVMKEICVNQEVKNDFLGFVDGLKINDLVVESYVKRMKIGLGFIEGEGVNESSSQKIILNKNLY